MLLRSIASILLPLAFCMGEKSDEKWSKSDQDLAQGEWVPVNNQRLSRESSRHPSAIEPHQFNQAFQQGIHQQGHFPEEVLGGQGGRIAFLHPQSLNPQPHFSPPPHPQPLIQQPIPSQQLLSQFLNQQIHQSSLPIYSRALLHKPAAINSNFFPQHDTYNLEPPFNQDQGNQYNFNPGSGFHSPVEEIPRPEQPLANRNQPAYTTNDQLTSNLTSEDPKKKEEVQILYVPVEMLRQQEQARAAAAAAAKKNQPDGETQNRQQNLKENKKFRHPIQPLKDQFPAYHLRGSVNQDKLYSSTISSSDTPTAKSTPRPNLVSHRTTSAPRSEYFSNYNSNIGASANKEQYGDESTVQDEISDFRNTITRRTPQRGNFPPPTPAPTLPPPNQPPLSVFMESTNNNRVGDVLGLLKDSKTIPVLDSVGPDAPQVFVGPSNLNTPLGYIKYELPYLSTLTANNVGPSALEKVPFFVAPLNFQPPPGYAKIPFPPPHIGSVVLSNQSPHTKGSERVNIPTPPSVEHHTLDYKETFTIPADISSISPQLPSLINSLQEEEYSGASSTESLQEVTEEPTRYRRPTSRGRQSSRGSQTYTTTTTRRPSSRQRKPSNRDYGQHHTEHSQSTENPLTKDEYTDNSYLNYKSNRRPTPTPQTVTAAPPQDNYYESNIDSQKQEQRTLTQTQSHDQFGNNFGSTPSTVLSYNEGSVGHQHEPNPGTYQQGRVQQFEQPHGIPEDSRSLGDQLHSTKSQADYHSPLSQSPNYHSQESPHSSGFAPSSYEDDKQLTGSNTKTGSFNSFEEPQFQQKTVANSAQDFSDEKVNYRVQDQYSGNQPTEAAHSQSNIPTSFGSDEQNNQHHVQTTDRQKANDYSQFEENYPQNAAQNNDYNEQNYENRYTPEPSTTQATEKPTTLRTRSRVRGRVNHQKSDEEDGQRTRSHYSRIPSRSNEESDEERTQTTETSATKKYLHSRGRRPLRPSSTRTSGTTTTTTTSAPPGTKYLIRTRRPTQPPTKLQPGRGRIRKPTSPTTTTEAAPTTEYPKELPAALLKAWKQQHGNEEEVAPNYNAESPLQGAVDYNRNPPQYQEGRTTVVRFKNPQNAQEEYYHQERHPTHNQPPQTKAPQYSFDSEENYPVQKTFETSTPVYTPHHSRGNKHHGNRNYETTTQPSYARDYERTLKTHYTREYEPTQRSYSSQEHETTQNPVHSFRDFETTPKPQYSREYEPTPKSQYTREYEPTPKSQYTRDYEPAPKSQYSRAYETTPKPQYSRETEAAPKSQYTRDFEHTPKPQFVREYETTRKPHLSRNYETTPKIQYSRDYESDQRQYTREYETTPKPFVAADYETTRKPQFSREYETTPNVQQYFEESAKPDHRQHYSSQQNYDIGQTDNNNNFGLPQLSQEYDQYDTTDKAHYVQDYVAPTRSHKATTQASYEPETTPKSQYSNHNYETTQKTYPSRGGNKRRRPAGVTRSEIQSSKPKYTPAETSTNKNGNDYWDQSVTIQQSQSYVYTPEGDLSPNEEESSPRVSIKPAHPRDYEDYYSSNSQEHGQYTSDQSPFPSNDQHVTVARIKPSLEVGKANQYPEKGVPYESSSPELLSQDPNDGYLAPTESSSEHMDDLSLEEVKSSPEETKSSTPIPVEEPPSSEEQPTKDVRPRKKGGKRKGTWVRVRVRKTKDVFETAESQRFSAIRGNALIPDLSSSKDLSKDLEGKDANITSPAVEDVSPSSPAAEVSQTTTTLSEKDAVATTTFSVGRLEEATTPLPTSAPGSDAELTTPADLQDTTKIEEEKIRTSTTTEISLETEICYKGQCIKTKRRKEDDNRSFPFFA